MCLHHVFPLPRNQWSHTMNCFMIGESGTHKTSMLFQFLHSHLLSKTDSVALYICSQDMKRLPVQIDQMPLPTIDSSSRLQVLYLSTLDDLFEYLAELYLIKSSVCALAVDDLQVFLTRKRLDSKLNGNYNQTLGRLFTLLLDTGAFMNVPVMAASGYDQHAKQCHVSLDVIGSQYFDQVLAVESLPCLSSERTAIQITDHVQQMRLQVSFENKKLKLKTVQQKSLLTNPN
jgi:hypothetical protein